MKSKLKLFVWTEFCPDYSSGLAFAIAKNEADARKQIEEKRGFRTSEWGTLTIHLLTRRFSEAVSGGG